MRLVEQVGEALHHGLAAFGLLDRPRLGGRDAEGTGHTTLSFFPFG
jgi:hypothetical protein